MAQHYNLVQVASTTTGTGTLTLGAAIPGFLTPALAGVLTGTVVEYSIRDSSASEMGIGTYSSTGPTLTRDKVLNSTNSGSKISCSGSEVVRFTPSHLGLSESAGMGLSLYLSDVASDISTYKTLALTWLDGASTEVASSALSAATDNQLVAVFATGPNTPHSYYIHRGLHVLHVWAKKAASMATTTIYAKLYHRETDATETLLATTNLMTILGLGATTALQASVSNEFEGTFYLYNRTLGNLWTPDQEYEMTIDSRLVVKIYANVGAGSGGAVTVSCRGWSQLVTNVDSLYFAERILTAVKAAHLYNNSNFR